MAIKIVGKCSNCGADVKLDENQEKGFCPYCGTEYAVDNSGQSLTEAAFSYLNKAGKRHQQNSQRRLEAFTTMGKKGLEMMEQRSIRKAAEKKTALIVGCCLLGVCIVISLIMAITTEKRSGTTSAVTAETNVVDEVVKKQGDLAADKTDETSATDSDIQIRMDKNSFDSGVNNTEHIGVYDFSVPSYYEADLTETDNYRAYADTGEKVVMLQVMQIEDDEPVTQEWIDNKEEIRQFAEDFLSSLSNATIVSDGKYSMGDKTGYKFDYTFVQGGVSGKGYSFIFPSMKDNSWILAGLLESDHADYEYYSDYEKIIESFTEVSDEGTKVEENGIKPAYDKKYALRAFVVALTNYYSADVFKSDGFTVDTKKFHKHSDTSGDFYFLVSSSGDWTPIDENTWEGTGICLKPNTGSGVVKNASCKVTYDGNNYVVSQMRGCYAIPGHEADVDSFSDIESESSNAVYLKVPSLLVE